MKLNQLTSIAALRASHAIQSRVTQVENFLKRQNPAWDNAWLFPIELVNVSNGGADCGWVRDVEEVHASAENLAIGNVSVSAQKVNDALENVSLAYHTTDFTALNTALSTAFGQPVVWTNGITEAAVVPAPFEKAASSAGAAKKRPAASKKSSTVKPIVTSPAKRTKLDEAKELFANLTPKQKVELVAWAEQKVLASKPCLAEREKLNTAAA